jgi:hypothetical protein
VQVSARGRANTPRPTGDEYHFPLHCYLLYTGTLVK